MISNTSWRAMFALFAMLTCADVALADESLRKAREFLDAKQYGKAYALLEPEADARAGEPEFDYLLGIAALDSGRATVAVFALERVLLAQPDNAGARAELARAHLRLGEHDQARHEFENVKRSELPASVERTIDDYLAALELAAGRAQTVYDIFVQTGLGYDENVNAATDVSQVAVPVLGGLLLSLDRTGRETDSAIWNIAAGFGVSTPVFNNEALRFFGRIRYDERLALDQNEFATRTFGGNGGYRYSVGPHQFSLGAQVQRFYVDGDPNRDLFGGTLQWQYSLSKRTQITAFGQAAALRFPGQEVRDVDRYTGGIGVAHAFDVRGQPVLFFSGYGGTEDEVEEQRPDQGRTLWGLRLGGQYSLTRKLVAYGNFSFEDSDYGRFDPIFLESRDDEFFDVTAGLRFALSRHWSIRPEVRYSENDSTLVVNDYDRINVMVYIRNDF